jgi:hypothetical protein
VRSRLILLGLAPLALALAACGSTSSSSPAKSTTAAKQPPKALTISVTSVVTTTRATDHPPKGTSKGDTVDFGDVLLNAAPQFGMDKNATVGSDKGRMTFTSKSTAKMNGVAKLPDGTIVFRGVVTVLPNNTITIPVIGGTGKYANASGTLLVGSGTKTARNTYTLYVVGQSGPIA